MAGVAQSTRRRHVLAPHQRDRPRRCGGRLTAESGCRPRPARQGAAHAAGAGEGGRRGCMAAADRARVAVWRCSPAFEGASTVQHGAADRMALGLSCHRACVVGMQPIGLGQRARGRGGGCLFCSSEPGHPARAGSCTGSSCELAL
ncbi:unnamed protein product [Prorocentrum cordatum]|uniref:Uncharacterized protein n=1 Tax=Prorocentrum cordatum TaxID=2364126 RepID=A0ABN9VK49_9DINO|nr:unnamed protein product [Polarella glacialis]